MTTLLASLLAIALLALVVAGVPARGDRCDLCWRRAYARLDHIRGEPAERSVPTGTGQIITERSIQCCHRHLDDATRQIQEAARHG